MKVLVSLGYLLCFSLIAKKVQAITDVEKANLGKIYSFALDCIQSYPLTITEIQYFRNKIFPDGENPKCFAACVFKKIGIMDELGFFSPAEIQKKAEVLFQVTEEQRRKDEELIQICSVVNDHVSEDGSKGCDRAKLIYECLIENAPKYGVQLDF